MSQSRKSAYLQSTIYWDVCEQAEPGLFSGYPEQVEHPWHLINAAYVIIHEFKHSPLAFLILANLSAELRQVIFDRFPLDFLQMSLAPEPSYRWRLTEWPYRSLIFDMRQDKSAPIFGDDRPGFY